MAHLTLALLGQFEAALDGKPLPRLGTDKTRALLAYLAVEMDRAHHREMLAGLLWPEQPEAAAHHNLSQALLVLRRALGDKQPALPNPMPFLLTTGKTLQFNPASAITLDVAEFQAGVALCATVPPAQLNPAAAHALTQAVARYHGAFLSTPLQVNSVAFEEWLLFKQTQFHILAVEALDYLVRYHEQRGEFALAIQYARQQLALDPLREQAHRQLIQALALAGQRPEALAHFAACRELLAQELGIEPAPETAALVADIRAARLTAPAIQTGEPPPPRALAPLCVGRARELTRLAHALTLTLTGQGQLRFVVGEAGSGKTTLLEAFARRAQAEHPELLVASGSGNAYTGRGDPYWPFIELFRDLSGQTSNGNTFPRPVVGQALAEAGPDLARLISTARLPLGAPELEQASLFDQLTRALCAIAVHYPLLLLLDDLHWADRDSLNLLLHLGRQLAGQRIFIIGAFRLNALDQGESPLDYLRAPETGPRHPLRTLVHELQRRLGDIQIDLAQAEGQAFIAALVDSEPNHLRAEFREMLYRHTGGHALFTAELIREMQARGDVVRDAQGYWVEGERLAWRTLPARVEAIIAERIGQLLPDWKSLLTLASVEGDEFTVEVLAQVQGLPVAEVTRRLSGALTRHHHLVAPVGVDSVAGHSLARYRFRHLLFQKYLYDQLDPVEQAHLHLAVGQALEDLYGARAGEISLSLARHFELGGELYTASKYLFQAGERAAGWAATEEALRLFTHALTLLQRLPPSPACTELETELQLALGKTLLAKGWNAPERARAFERAYALCQHAGGSKQLARSLLNLADVHIARGQLDQAVAIGEQLLNLAQTSGNALIAVFAHFVLGMTCFFQGRLLLAREHLEQVTGAPLSANALPAHAEVGLATRSWVWLMETLWALGYAEQAAVCCQQAVAQARTEGHAFSLGFVLSIGELSLGWFRRDFSAMRITLHHLADLGQGTVLSIFQLWGAIFQGWLSAVEEHDPAGLRQLQQNLDQWVVGGQSVRAYHYLLLSEALLALDQVAAAQQMLERTLTQSAATGGNFFKAEMLRLQGEVSHRLGQPEEAAANFLEAITIAQKQSAKMWELRAVLSLCRLRQATGTPREVAAARQQLAEIYAWFTEGWDMPDLQEAVAISTGNKKMD